MYIYKTTNLINNKIYIGLSTKTVEESTDYYGSGSALNHAFSKYGKENFKKEIIERDLKDLDLLCKREIYWISHYNSTDNNIGYNIHHGGEFGGDTLTNNPNIEEISFKISKANKAKWADPEYKAKMSMIMKNTWADPEYKAKMSEMHKGHPSYPNQRAAASKIWKGKKLPEEVKQKIREAQTGKRYSDEVNKSKGRPGRETSEEHRKNLSKALKGIPKNPDSIKKMKETLTGRKLSEEHRRAISKGQTGIKHNHKERTCPHCGLTGKGGNMTRYHFDNCIKNL